MATKKQLAALRKARAARKRKSGKRRSTKRKSTKKKPRRSYRKRAKKYVKRQMQSPLRAADGVIALITAASPAIQSYMTITENFPAEDAPKAIAADIIRKYTGVQLNKTDLTYIDFDTKYLAEGWAPTLGAVGYWESGKLLRRTAPVKRGQGLIANGVNLGVNIMGRIGAISAINSTIGNTTGVMDGSNWRNFGKYMTQNYTGVILNDATSQYEGFELKRAAVGWAPVAGAYGMKKALSFIQKKIGSIKLSRIRL